MCSQRDTNTLIKRKQRHSKNSILVSKISLARPGEVGRTNLGYHEIKLQDEKVIREPPRRVSIHKRSLRRGRSEIRETKSNRKKYEFPVISYRYDIEEEQITKDVCRL